MLHRHVLTLWSVITALLHFNNLRGWKCCNKNHQNLVGILHHFWEYGAKGCFTYVFTELRSQNFCFASEENWNSSQASQSFEMFRFYKCSSSFIKCKCRLVHFSLRLLWCHLGHWLHCRRIKNQGCDSLWDMHFIRLDRDSQVCVDGYREVQENYWWRNLLAMGLIFVMNRSNYEYKAAFWTQKTLPLGEILDWHWLK